MKNLPSNRIDRQSYNNMIVPELASLKEDIFDKNTYLLNYKKIMPRYISDSNPSTDTLSYYYSNIDMYLKWCIVNKVHPLEISELQFTYYREFLLNANYKNDSMVVILAAIKQFYNVAVRLKVIQDNPIKNIKVKKKDSYELAPTKYLLQEELAYLLSIIDERDEACLRDKAMIMLMALEGLRTVEVYRMSLHDIDWKNKTIYIHGKNHNDYIYPRDDTMAILQKYISMRDCNTNYKDNIGVPVFTRVSNNHKGKRIERNGIRLNVNKWLDWAGLKHKQISCHMLRHTCGTIIYENTKDLQIVKAVLRHKDINMSSRYSHIKDRLKNRYSNVIDTEEKSIK